MIYMRSVFHRAKILSTIETKQANYHIFANEQAERRRSAEAKVDGRPAKLNEKKGDRDLEREIKNKGDIFLLGEQHENFVAAVTK